MRKIFPKIFAMMLALAMLASVALVGCDNGGDENKLAQPASVTYADGTLSWSAVEGAETYGVTVYERGSDTEVLATQTVAKTSLDVSSLDAGDYTAGVVANAEGKTSSDEKREDFTVAAAPTALATPTGFAYADGKVTWGAVSGAAGYTVEVADAGGTAVIAEQKINAAELSVSSLAAGTYTITVTANGTSGVSLDSLAAEYTFTVEPVLTKLATPSGGAVDIENRKVTWTAVSGATSYLVSGSKGGETVFNQQTVTAAEISIAGVEETEFTLTVIAVGDPATTTNSDPYNYEVKIEAVPMDAPTDIGLDADEEDLLIWSEVAMSDAYRLIIRQGENNPIVDTELIVNEYDISDLAVGSYTVTVQTLADPDDIFVTDSAVSSYDLTIESLGAFQAIENLRISGGYFRWDANNARGYDIVVTERGDDQPLALNGVTAADNSFMIAGIGLTSGDYTFSVTPVDNRHDTERGTAATFDFTLTVVQSFDAEDIAGFDGNSPVGEHGRAELVTYNDKQVAKVTPTADGWGRVGSSAVTVNYNSNPVLYIDIEGLEVGGYHAQIRVNGENYSVLNDSATNSDSAVSMKVGEITGTQSTNIRLGVDNSSSTTANDAIAYYNGCTILYLTEYTAAFEGQLGKVEGYNVSNGMDIAWDGVENADSYYVTVVNSDGVTVHEKAAQSAVSLSARDYAEGTYTITVSAFDSGNPLALESEETSFTFKVAYLETYSAEDISGFDQVLVGDPQTIGYDEDTNTAILNPNKDRGYGAIAPATGVEVNLSNMPFARVDTARVDYGYLVRGRFTPSGGSAQVLVLRNDTPVVMEDGGVLYIELWRKADQNNAPVYGSGTYQFGMGFLAGSNQGQVVLNNIRLVEITAVTENVPGANVKLDTPTEPKEEKGVLSANPVNGNSEYTPTYQVVVTPKDGGAAVYDQSGLASPSVNLYEINLVSGTIYTVSIIAEGDTDDGEQNYFADSDPCTVEIAFEEIVVIDDFSDLDYTTYASLKGGNTQFTTAEDGSFVSTVANGGWGYDFFNIDISEIKEDLTNDYYLAWKIDLEKSTEGANIATRFINSAGEAVGTGWGDSSLQAAFLTKEWSDKIDATDTIWFAFGQGGASVSTPDADGNKVVVLESMSFVKYTLNTQVEA